jgi:hypothetical protein
MERTTDWKGPVAIVLAGLALLVALSGRGILPFSLSGGSENMFVEAQSIPVPLPPEPAMPPEKFPGMQRPGMRPEGKDVWGVFGHDLNDPNAPTLAPTAVPPDYGQFVPVAPPDIEYRMVRPPQEPAWLVINENPVDSLTAWLGRSFGSAWSLLQTVAILFFAFVVLRYFFGNRRPYPASPQPLQPQQPPAAPPPPPGVLD